MRWFARQPRAWFAAGCWLVAIVAAAADRRPGWTVFVATNVGLLAALTVRFRYEDEHPHRAAARAAKQQAEVDKILWRYERQAAARARAAAVEPPDDAPR
jgi:hypothetical protein